MTDTTGSFHQPNISIDGSTGLELDDGAVSKGPRGPLENSGPIGVLPE